MTCIAPDIAEQVKSSTYTIMQFILDFGRSEEFMNTQLADCQDYCVAIWELADPTREPKNSLDFGLMSALTKFVDERHRSFVGTVDPKVLRVLEQIGFINARGSQRDPWKSQANEN